MTRETRREVIDQFNYIKELHTGDESIAEICNKAIDMLDPDQRNHPYWVQKSHNTCACPECKQTANKQTKFCPNCGIRLLRKPRSKKSDQKIALEPIIQLMPETK